jgi:hypothetical protein
MVIQWRTFKLVDLGWYTLGNLHALWCVGAVCDAIQRCVWFMSNFHGLYCETIFKIPLMKSSRWPSGLIKIQLPLNLNKRDTEICNSGVLSTNLTIGCGNKVMGVVRTKFRGVEICENLACWKRVNIPRDLLRHVPRGLVITHDRRVQLTLHISGRLCPTKSPFEGNNRQRRHSPYKKWCN